jgi:hypothetical protein
VLSYETESESNRTFPAPVRFGFGSVELSKSEFGFGSTEFLKCRFEFGSVRLESNRTDKIRFEPTKIAKESYTLAF